MKLKNQKNKYILPHAAFAAWYEEIKNMKVFTGVVISKKMAKTVTVRVDRVVVHPLYKKRFKQSKKYHVHDDTDSAVGQKVSFVACKPISKMKKWKVIETKTKEI